MMTHSAVGENTPAWKNPEINILSRKTDPVLACTAEELERLRAAWKSDGPLQRVIVQRIAGADKLMAKPLVFPPRGGQHNQWYQCDACQLALRTVSPTKHLCPRCRKTYSGEPYDDVIFSRRHQQNLAGMLDAATASFAKARKIGEELGDPEPVAVSEMGALTVDLAAGRLPSAIRRAKACLPTAHRLGLHHLALQTRGNLALALMDSGQHAKALSQLRSILPFLSANGPAYQAAFTERNIGECLAALGKPDAANRTLKRALEAYNELGMADEAKVARKLMQRAAR